MRSARRPSPTCTAAPRRRSRSSPTPATPFSAAPRRTPPPAPTAPAALAAMAPWARLPGAIASGARPGSRAPRTRRRRTPSPAAPTRCCSRKPPSRRPWASCGARVHTGFNLAVTVEPPHRQHHHRGSPTDILNDFTCRASLPVRPRLFHPSASPGVSFGGRNAGYREVEGYDVDVSYRWDWASLGAFRINSNSTYTSKDVTLATNDPRYPISSVGVTSTFRIRSNLSLNWERGIWGASWNARYYSAMAEGCTYFVPGLNEPNLECNQIQFAPTGAFITGTTDPPAHPPSHTTARPLQRVQVPCSCRGRTVAVGANHVSEDRPSCTPAHRQRNYSVASHRRFLYVKYTRSSIHAPRARQAARRGGLFLAADGPLGICRRCRATRDPTKPAFDARRGGRSRRPPFRRDPAPCWRGRLRPPRRSWQTRWPPQPLRRRPSPSASVHASPAVARVLAACWTRAQAGHRAHHPPARGRASVCTSWRTTACRVR